MLHVPSLNTNPNDDYINANLAALPLVAPPQHIVLSQGPTDTTSGAFWQMVLQLRITTLVMLTECVEGGRLKCHAYWPQQRLATQQYGPIAVQNIEAVQMGAFTVTTLVVSNGDSGEVRVVDVGCGWWMWVGGCERVSERHCLAI